jgi:hypothetical protein
MGVHGEDTGLLVGSSENNIESISVVLSAYRSVIHPLAYVSMPITSGKRLYDVFEQARVHSIDELKEKEPGSVYNDILKPNVMHGIDSARKIAGDISLPVIAPSIFEARKQRWGENEYMFLWYRVLEEKIQEIYMTDGWQYSNGGAQEFVRAIEMQFGFINPHNGMEFFPQAIARPIYPLTKNIIKRRKHDRLFVKWANEQHERLAPEFERLKGVKIYDESSNELHIDKGYYMLIDAIASLINKGFAPMTLFESAEKLHAINDYFHHDPFKPDDIKPPYDYDYMGMWCEGGTVWSHMKTIEKAIIPKNSASYKLGHVYDKYFKIRRNKGKTAAEQWLKAVEKTAWFVDIRAKEKEADEAYWQRVDDIKAKLHS